MNRNIKLCRPLLFLGVLLDHLGNQLLSHLNDYDALLPHSLDDLGDLFHRLPLLDVHHDQLVKHLLVDVLHDHLDTHLLLDTLHDHLVKHLILPILDVLHEL